MSKTDMLVKRIKELTDESKRNGVWESLNEEIKDAVKTLINKLGAKSNFTKGAIKKLAGGGGWAPTKKGGRRRSLSNGKRFP